MIDMKERETKTRPFLLLCVLILLSAVSGCTFLPGPNVQNGHLVIAVGLSSPDTTKKTYTPEFDLYTFEKVVIRVTQEITIEEIIDDIAVETVVETVFAEISRDPGYQSLTFELPDLPYDTYIITARAYVRGNHEGDNYAAIGKKEFEFNSASYSTTVFLDPVINEEGTKGTLRYKLINAIGLPVNAKLYPLDEVDNPEAVMILTQGSNPLDTLYGFHTMVLDTGYYVFFFGEDAPNIVHIYKNMATVLEYEYTIYGAVTRIIYSQGISDIQIILTTEETIIDDEDIFSYGTDIKVTIIKGNDYRYKPNTLKLNNGLDNHWLIGEEIKSPDGTYTRTFRMPAGDVLVSVESEPIPKVAADFSDPVMTQFIKFYSVSGGASEPIKEALPGQTIRVSFDHPAAAETTFTVQSWWMDEDSQGGPGDLTFTVPNPCNNYWYVTVLLTIGDIPYSASLPIKH